MPYRKTYKKPMAKKGKKKGGWLNTAAKVAKVGLTAATAAKALSVAYRTATLINPEFKFTDFGPIQLDSTTPFDSSNPVIVDVTQPMIQGIGGNQFTGISVLMKSFFLRMQIVPNQNVSGNPWTTVRVLIFIDKNMDGTSPTVTDILQSNSYLSPMSMNMPDRYMILHDRSYTASNSGQYAKPVKIFKKLRHHFKVSNASPTTDRAGRIFMLFITDSPNPYGPFLNYYYRLRFIDN